MLSTVSLSGRFPSLSFFLLLLLTMLLFICLFVCYYQLLVPLTFWMRCCKFPSFRSLQQHYIWGEFLDSVCGTFRYIQFSPGLYIPMTSMLTFGHSSITYGAPASTGLLLECRRKQTMIRNHKGGSIAHNWRNTVRKYMVVGDWDRIYLERLLRGSDH